jgi:hypothetical protein
MALKNGPRRTVYRSPRMVAEFSLSYSGIAKIAMSQPIQDCVDDVCAVALAYAQFISPVQTGDYINSFDCEQYIETEIGGPPLGRMDRRAARMWNVSSNAMLVEVGNQNFPGHRIFAKTLDAIENHGEMMR